jgi:hypothetical protein
MRRLELRYFKPRGKIRKPRIDQGDRSRLEINNLKEGWTLNLRASYNQRYPVNGPRD